MKKILCVLLMLCCCTVMEAKRTGMFLFFDLPQNHLYEDANVKVVIAFEGTAKLVVYNKTDQVIYVDKENTFAYTNNVPENLFKNTVQTTGKSSNSGATVNMGSVASALGIGGALGTLASGVNVGGGSGTTSSTMTYEKRILSIAPEATAILYEWNPVEDLGKTRYIEEKGWLGSNGYFMYPTKVKFKKGMVRNFSNDTPLLYKAVVRYSTQENFSTYEQATVDNYLAHIVIDSYKGVKKGSLYRTYSNSYCQSLPYVASVIGDGDSNSWLMGGLGVEIVGLAAVLAIAAEK